MFKRKLYLVTKLMPRNNVINSITNRVNNTITATFSGFDFRHTNCTALWLYKRFFIAINKLTRKKKLNKL